MRLRQFAGAYVLAVSALFFLGITLGNAQSGPWATAYYAGWMQGGSNNGHLAAQDIDYSAVTHIVHFSIVPNGDGSLNSSGNSITAGNSSELLSRAHAAGKKVLISVGGWGSDVGFRGATGTVTRALFVTNLINFVTSRGYDGIDIDWEVLQSSDAAQFTAFITALRTALNAISPRPLLTAATAWQLSIFAQVHSQFDQINIMTYDLSGAWPGWVTWHNAPVYDGGYRFPGVGTLVPSVNGTVDAFIGAGIPANKLGIGIDFYGYVWSGGSGTSTGGVTEPRQSWTSAPTVQDNVPYHTIMQNYYQSQYYRWDDAAQAAYLRIDDASPANCKFISYDDETTVQKKFQYVRTKGIGGVIIWELGGGYRADQPAGQRDRMLQAVKTARSGATGIDPGHGLPLESSLGQNYPNPFNPTTNIDFRIVSISLVTLKIFNVLGQEVATLVQQELAAGTYTRTWSATGLASGAYLYRLEVTPNSSEGGAKIVLTKQLVVLK